MKNAPVLCCIAFLLLLMTGCASLVQEPRVNVTRTVIIGLDTSGVDLECLLDITNPNSYDLALLGYNYDLRVLSLPLASGGVTETVTMPAGKRVDMRIPIRVRFGDLIQILKRQPDPDKVPYRLQARLHLATPLGDMTVPVDREETFSVPENYRPEHYLNALRGMLPTRP